MKIELKRFDHYHPAELAYVIFDRKIGKSVHKSIRNNLAETVLEILHYDEYRITYILSLDVINSGRVLGIIK